MAKLTTDKTTTVAPGAKVIYKAWSDGSATLEGIIRDASVAYARRGTDGWHYAPSITEPEDFQPEDFAAFAAICSAFAGVIRLAQAATFAVNDRVTGPDGQPGTVILIGTKTGKIHVLFDEDIREDDAAQPVPVDALLLGRIAK